jgi:hypothetical protein
MGNKAFSLVHLSSHVEKEACWTSGQKSKYNDTFSENKSDGHPVKTWLMVLLGRRAKFITIWETSVESS